MSVANVQMPAGIVISALTERDEPYPGSILEFTRNEAWLKDAYIS